jgi:hypothetical protein
MDNRCLVADPIRDSGVDRRDSRRASSEEPAPCVRDDRRHPKPGVGSDSQLFELARGLALGPLSFSSERGVSGYLPLTRASHLKLSVLTRLPPALIVLGTILVGLGAVHGLNHLTRPFRMSAPYCCPSAWSQCPVAASRFSFCSPSSARGGRGQLGQLHQWR